VEGGGQPNAYFCLRNHILEFFAQDKIKNHKKSFKNDKNLVQMPNNLYSES
jgi:hypothetical protein